MTVQMPEPIPLDMPPGDADAIAELVGHIRSAGRCLASVDVRVSGPAADTVGWLGDDATAAAAQMTAVGALMRSAHDGLTSAADGLAEHAEHLLETRSRITVLLHEQAQQFREAWRRWYALPDLQAELMMGGPGVRAIVADVEAGEAGRRRRQHALLEEVEDDAAACARVLLNSCAAVGGRGGAYAGNQVVAYLAAQLPGWGDRRLTRLGRALGDGLTAGTPSEKADAASRAALFAGSVAFANALLAALGARGVDYVLTDLAGGVFGDGTAAARTLAAAFGAADPGEASDDPVRSVLDAEYVRAGDDFGKAADLATGLAMVLVACTSTPSGGVPTRTVAGWARQFLVWENAHGQPLGRRSAERAREVGDPTGLAINVLAQRADPRTSAALLDDPVIWTAALRRPYDDGGAALGAVVAQAGREAGARGDRVVLTGLATAGAGLAGDDPAAWTVNRNTLAGVAPGLGGAASTHVDVAVEALQVGAAGRLRGSQADVLAGLGYVTLDRDAAAGIERALSAWAQVRPEALAGTGSEASLGPANVLGAYVAVQEFAQRTDHAMDALENRALAGAKQSLEKHTWGLVGLLPGPAGDVIGSLEDAKASALHLDGTWHDLPDRGLVFNRTDAGALARTSLGAQGPADERAVIRQGRAAYERATESMPVREAPTSPDGSPASLIPDPDVVRDRMERDYGGTTPRIPRPR